jgi:hypothetical protein
MSVVGSDRVKFRRRLPNKSNPGDSHHVVPYDLLKWKDMMNRVAPVGFSQMLGEDSKPGILSFSA